MIESVQSLGMDNLRVAYTRFLVLYSDNPSGRFVMEKRWRNDEVGQVSPLTPGPKLDGRQNF